MSEKIKNYIDQLDKISVGGIEKDDFNDEFNDVKDILNAIKNNPREGKPTKQQLKEIISFLNTQSLKVIGNRATIYGELRKYQSDFENLLKNYDEEVLGIKEKSESDKTTLKKDMSEWKDPDLVSNIIKKTKTIKTKPQNNFSDLEKKSFEEIININETEKYKVKSGDRLWNIVETKYPNLTKSNKEIIHIINYIVNFNIEKNPSKLKHLKRDDKLAGGVRGSDGIAGDKIRIGDIIELPNIKTKTGLTDEANNTADLEKQKLEEALKLKKSELIEKSNGIIDEIKNKKIKEEIENCKDIACLEKISKKIEIILLEQNVSETSEVANNWKTIGFNKDGENYIIGKDGEPKLITTQELTPEFKKSLEKYQETLVIAENINILLSALTQSGEDVSKEIIKIQTSINTFNPSKIDESNTIIQSTIKDVFKGLNIDNKEDIKLEERISVLKYIRNELDNYEFVRKNIVEKQFNSLTNISEEELALFIENPNSEQEKIKKILGEEEYKDFVDEIIEKRAEAKKYFNKNKIELQKQFPTIKLEEIEGFVIDSFTSTFAKIEISELFIDKNLSTYMGGYNGTNKELALFSDIQGIGGLDISDKNSNIGEEAIILIVTEIAAIAAGALTMGAGAYAVNAAVYGRRAYKGIQYLQSAGKLANTTIKGAKLTEQGSILAARTGRFAAMSTIEGGAFYAGYGAVQSGVEGKNMYTKEGLAESIAFMGAFKALNGLYKFMGRSVNPNIPLNEQKLTIPAKLSQSIIFKMGLDGATFSSLGLITQGIILEPGEWTAETIIQAFVMAAAFRGIGAKMEQIKLRQRNGEVEAVKEVKTVEYGPKEPYGPKAPDNYKIPIKNNTNKPKNVIEGPSSPVEFYKTPGKNPQYFTKTKEGAFINSKSNEVISLSEINKEIKKLENMINVRLNKKQTQSIKKEIKKLREDKEFWENEQKTLKSLVKVEVKDIPKELKTKVEPKVKEEIKPEKEKVEAEPKADKETNSKKKTEQETKKQEETINDSQIKELAPKKIDSLFEKHFTKEMNSKGQIQIGEKTYKKRNDGKYERSGDNTLYTKKEVLKQISLDDKKIILEKTAKNRVSELEAEKTIKLKDGIFDWKGKYKVSKDEIIIKENGKERKLSKEEETQFYKDHYEEILNKFGFNIKKDSEILVDKIKEKLSGSKGVDMIKSINKFLESIPALGHLYKGGKWIGKQGIDSMLTPINIVKNIKNAKGFEETLKSIIFANKDIGYIKGVGKVGGMIAIPTIAEIIYETNTTPQGSMSLSPGNIAANYGEMMYLGVINTLIIEGFNIDEWALNETP